MKVMMVSSRLASEIRDNLYRVDGSLSGVAQNDFRVAADGQIVPENGSEHVIKLIAADTVIVARTIELMLSDKQDSGHNNHVGYRQLADILHGLTN